MERPWLPALPKIEKELELMRVCIDSINVHVYREDPISKNIVLHSQNILFRYLKNLDLLTSYQKSLDPKFDKDE